MATDTTDETPPHGPPTQEGNVVLQAINWAYDTALDGFSGFEGARVMAANATGSTQDDRASDVINWSCAKAAGIGALTSIGGFITMPVTLPANLAGTALVQMRLVQALAIIGGRDPKDERVRTMALLAALGMSAADVLKGIGVSVAQALTEQAIKDVVVQALAKAVVKGSISRASSKTIASSVSRVVPLVGAVVGGAIDAGATYTIGVTAKGLFMPAPEPTDVTG